jgi:hypothetical protein
MAYFINLVELKPESKGGGTEVTDIESYTEIPMPRYLSMSTYKYGTSHILF